MDSTVLNFLYRRPDLYEYVYDGSDHAVPRMCEKLFMTYLGHQPTSLLDIGSGTGRDFDYFSRICNDFVGMDYQSGMVDYARKKYPGVEWLVGDMRSFNLDRRFQSIVCLGLAVNYMLSNADVTQAMATFARHAKPGALLIIEVINSIADPLGGRLPSDFVIDTPDFKARAHSEFHALRRQQLLSRSRTWLTSDGETILDSVKWRLIFPMELEGYLSASGFKVLAMYDNTDLIESDLTGASLFVVAQFGSEASK